MYSPWRTVSQVWHLKHHTCHCRSRATKAWPSRNWFPQPAQAPGSEGPSPDPLVAELLPTGVEASRTGIPTHRWHRAWPIDNARLVEIGQIRSTIWPRTTDSLTHTLYCLLFEKRTRINDRARRIFAADSSFVRVQTTRRNVNSRRRSIRGLFSRSIYVFSRINNRPYDRACSPCIVTIEQVLTVIDKRVSSCPFEGQFSPNALYVLLIGGVERSERETENRSFARVFVELAL